MTALSGSETILVVEDDEVVRVIVRQILTGYGYTVLEAGSGPDAIAICRQHTGPIHLLLADIVMPGGMNGPKLAEQLLLLFPHLKVLYTSGYPGDAIAHHSDLVTTMPFISKPFSPMMLGQKVRQVLDSNPTITTDSFQPLALCRTPDYSPVQPE